jgi:hypothetical protein
MLYAIETLGKEVGYMKIVNFADIFGYYTEFVQIGIVLNLIKLVTYSL